MYRPTDIDDEEQWEGEEWEGETDDVIGDEIDTVLLDRLSFNLQPIDVSVSHGTVTLRGLVRTRELRTMAAVLAGSVPGVREVINEIEVTGDS